MAEHGLERYPMVANRSSIRAEKFVPLLLLFILLTAATAGVTAVLTGPDWASLWESLLIGLLVGWSLAIFRWPFWRSALLVLGLGLLFCLLFAGGLNEKVEAVFVELFRLPGSVPSWVRTREIDLTHLHNVMQQLFAAIEVVSERVVVWVRDLIGGQAVFDPVATGVVWSLVVWMVSAWAGWVVEARHNALVSVLPALGLNLSTLSYGRSYSITIYLMLGVTLVLIALVQYDQHQQQWDATKVAYPRRKNRQVGSTSLWIAIGLVLISAFLSSLSLSRIAQWTTKLNPPASQNSGLAKSLGIQEPSPTPDAFSTARSPGLPRSLLIGAGPELSTEQVMSVEVSDLTSLVQSGSLPPLYWRSFTYDIYDGHGWSSSPTDQVDYQPNQPIQPGQLPDHQLIQEVVNPVTSQGGTLYAAGEPVSLNVASSAAWRSANDLFGIQTGDASYTVQSMIPMVSEDSLRATGQDYPNWVAQHYLVLPAEVPNRVRQLAIQLTATLPTPYDRARAIEQYLRSNYPYNTDVPHPPANQDLVDYFLFDLHEGYCDYYASAMVVLARAAGIPARLAVGYSSGTYNLNSRRFIVTQADAHSWVEIYFPGIGWVPFEPTAARPEINRSAQTLQVATPTATPANGRPSAGTTISKKLIGYVTLGLLTLVGFIWAIYDEFYLRQLEPRPAAVEIYRRIRRYGNLLKVAHENGHTPFEYGQALTSSLTSINREKSGLSTRVSYEVELILQHIVRLSYRPDEEGETTKIQIVNLWKSLRWGLRRVWVLLAWESVLQLIRGGILSGSDKMLAETGVKADGK